MLFFHKHKFGKVEEDGFQYCEGCGKAIRPAPPECRHIWQRINTVTISNPFGIQYYRHVLTCKKCGKMDTYTVGT